VLLPFVSESPRTLLRGAVVVTVAYTAILVAATALALTYGAQDVDPTAVGVQERFVDRQAETIAAYTTGGFGEQVRARAQEAMFVQSSHLALLHWVLALFLAGAAVVVLQGEIPRSGIEAAARTARGRLVVNLAPVVDVDESVLLRADPLVVNEHEAELAARMLGVAPSLSPSVDPVETTADGEEAVVRGLLARGVRSVVLTVGPRGALVGQGDDVVHVPSPRVHAVDTTGAGDAFVGALARGLAAGDGLVDAARTAARVGAFAVRSPGAQASYPGPGDELPQVDEVPA
jgi:ribokinase